MRNEQLAIARIQDRAQTRAQVLELLKNPVVEIILGYLVIEYLQAKRLPGTAQELHEVGRSNGDYGVIPAKAGTVAELALLIAVAYQQLAPAAQYAPATIEALGNAIPIKEAVKMLPLAGV